MVKVQKKKKPNNFYKCLSYILILFTVFSFSVLLYFDVLPSKYLILSGITIGIIVIFIMYKLNAKSNLLSKLICVLLSIIFIFIELLGSIYAFGTIDFFNNIFDTGYHIESYSIYVIKKDYLSLKDLNNKNIGLKDNEDDNLDKALDKL